MKKELPPVSVVTPSYDSASFIEETIMSIKNQTYSNIEHIIMDGGSTDGTLDIIKKYEGTYNMRWISQPDKGQSDAINKGWQSSGGEILSWLNSDDTYLPQAVETAVKFLNDYPDVSVVYGDCNMINEQGEIIGRFPAHEFDLEEMLCRELMIAQPAAFFRREILDKVGFLDIDLYYAMDFDLWVRIAISGLKLKYIPQLLASFRVYPETKTSSGGSKAALEALNIVDKIFSNTKLPKEVKVLRGRAYSHRHFIIGRNYHFRNEMKQARKHLLKAINLNPRSLLNPWMIGYLLTSLPGGRALKTVLKPASKLFPNLG